MDNNISKEGNIFKIDVGDLPEQDATRFLETTQFLIDYDTIKNTTEKRLHTTTDAAVWAEEFMKIAKKLEIKGIDEGWMIGWFANAIETGRQFGRNSVKICQCP